MTAQHEAPEGQTLGALVALLLLVAAAVAGVQGKNKVAQAGPAAPERAIQGIKDDITTVKGGHHE